MKRTNPRIFTPIAMGALVVAFQACSQRTDSVRFDPPAIPECEAYAASMEACVRSTLGTAVSPANMTTRDSLHRAAVAARNDDQVAALKARCVSGLDQLRAACR